MATGPAAFLLAALVLTAVGVALRVGDFRAVAKAHGQLGPDAREYLQIARQMKGFYWPTYREPLHPALIRVATWVVGPGQDAARTVSLTFSSLLVLVTALAGRRLYGTWPALLAATVVAFSEDYLGLSTEGLRPELYSVLLLTFLVLLAARRVSDSPAKGGRTLGHFDPPDVSRPGARLKTGATNSDFGELPSGLSLRVEDSRVVEPGAASFLPVIFAGVTGGLLCLTQMTALVFVFPGLLLWALGRRPQPGPGARLQTGAAALVGMLLAVLMVAPYLYLCHRYLGDSMVWITHHSTWWHQREELIKRSASAAGAPEAGGESVAPAPSPPASSPPGPQRPPGEVTVTRYLVGERSLAEFLGRFVRGYASIFYAYTAVFWVFIRAYPAVFWVFVRSLGIGWLSRLAVVVGAAGFLGLLRSLWEGPRLPVAVALLSLLPVSFVGPVGAETRLFLHVLPLWVMWVAWGLAWLVKVAASGLSGGLRRLTRSRARPQT